MSVIQGGSTRARHVVTAVVACLLVAGSAGFVVAAGTRPAAAARGATVLRAPTAPSQPKGKPANGSAVGATAATAVQAARQVKAADTAGAAAVKAAAGAHGTKVASGRPSTVPSLGAGADDDDASATAGSVHLPGSNGGRGGPTPPGVEKPSARGPAASAPAPTTGTSPAARPARSTAAPASLLRATDPCGPGGNPIVCENQKPGTPDTVWDISGAGDPTLQGFTTDVSANVGETVHFKISSTAAAYRIDIYRLGWYQGNGARLITSFSPQVPYPQPQPACLNDVATGLIDCGNWTESASWAVPSDAVSGVYFARLTRTDNGGASHVVFVVRNDASTAQVMLQTSDSTWAAYNNYGGNSLYSGSPVSRAYKVSYNRPITTRVTEENGHNWIFSAEYPMIRFLERNGYDTTYTTDVDSDRRGNLIKNHRIFVSSGHDEYWSGAQRANVEAARDAGVNLAFFSANEVYWRTRWEPSIDGSSTNYRTLVVYKETKNAAPTDPMYPSQWTGTWRDPEYSPPSNGGRPENNLTGTMYMVDPPTDFAMQVPAQYAKLRFWRNTPHVSKLQAGQTQTLSAATLGYEFDIDADNGQRPAGLFDLSGQTESVDHELKDYGAVVAPGTVTHHMTLYRAPSGALVFGAGTIQWAWGLDEEHDGPQTTQDPDMQQATVNLFADMGVQPGSLMSGLVAATRSTDTTPPTSTITASAQHGTVGANSSVGGTAADTGGGVVAGVEVSVDGGSTWHPATGTTSWTYTYQPTTPGTVSVKVRAADDSGNIQTTPASGSYTVDRRTCPCTIFGTTAPRITDSGDSGAYELGVRFRATIDGTVTGVRFYKSAANAGTHTGSLWTNDGQRLATGTFGNETASGWQTLTFATPVAVTAGTTYVASYWAPQGHYAGDPAFYSNGSSAYVAPLLALPDGSAGGNGVFHAGSSAFPGDSFRSSNYGVDVVFSGDTSTDVAPPAVVDTTPESNASSVVASPTVSASFTKPVSGGSLQFTLTGNGSTVVARTAVTQGGLTATLTPSAALAPGVTYTASVSAADTQGHVMTTPFTWSFRTGATQAAPGTCPCSVWSDQQQPANTTSNDTGSVELGVKIRPSSNGYITGVRFFKGEGNTGTHTGSLWTTSGQLLATATFTDETTSGWQQVTFDPPVEVTAGTDYVASYHAPNGRYAYSPSYFAAGASYGPLSALKDGVDGADGLFVYGAGTSFPNDSYRSSNYWVDVTFQTTPPPPQPPAVARTLPAGTGGALSSPLTAAFNKPVDPATIAFTLKRGSTALAGTTSYDATSNTAYFTPAAAFDPGTAYTAGVQATATNGVAMTAPATWSFTTGTPAACPCSLFTGTIPSTTSSSDTSAYELGVRFRSDQTGYVTGVRFYKGAGNTGTHTGSLWTTGGQLLATGTFSGETASGWQTMTFDAPVPVTAGTDYVASYHTDTGHYSFQGNWFTQKDTDKAPLHALATAVDRPNGVFRVGAGGFPATSFQGGEYGVDVNFALTATDTRPPQVASSAPAAGATGVTTLVHPAVTFSEAVDPAGIALTVSGGAGSVAGTTAYDAASKTVTFTPSAALAESTAYTVTVSARDLAGNAMSPASWHFTTVAAADCPCTLFGSAAPASADSDSSAVEVGVRFTSEANRTVTGVRFYKTAGNTGTHTGTLWSADGTALATGTFANESASGWQTLTFATPVPITANTVYVASYHTDTGHLAYTSHYYDSAHDAPPLHAPAGDNGFYRYGASGFPTDSYNSTDYGIDVTVQ